MREEAFNGGMPSGHARHQASESQVSTTLTSFELKYISLVCVRWWYNIIALILSQAFLKRKIMPERYSLVAGKVFEELFSI
jgi:hypothetical protein